MAAGRCQSGRSNRGCRRAHALRTAQQALAATITQTGPFPVGNLLNYANSDIESAGFNWAADKSQASNVISIGKDDTTSLMHAHSLKIVASGAGPMIYKLGNSQDSTSAAITLPRTGGDYRVGAYMKVPASTSEHTVEFDLECYDSAGTSLGWMTGTPVTMNPGGSWQYVEDDFLASVPAQQEVILVWAQEPEGKGFDPMTMPGCNSATSDAMAFKCETKLQATFVHNSPGDTPNVLIAQDSAGSKYADGQVGAGCTWITPPSATGAGVDLYLVDHYEYDTVTGQNVNEIPAADVWQNWLKCASAKNRPLGFGEYGLDNSPDPDPNAPQQSPQYPKGCKSASQNRTKLPDALDADRNYLSQLPMSGDPSLLNPAPFVVWDYWDSFWGGTPDCTVLDDQAAIDRWRSIETQNGGGG